MMVYTIAGIQIRIVLIQGLLIDVQFDKSKLYTASKSKSIVGIGMIYFDSMKR
jgi:hypothetical protein